jgi:sugar-phosphatase
VGRIIRSVCERIRREGVALPGVVELLELLSRKGKVVALVSTSSREVINSVLDVLDIRHHFNFIFSGDDEARGKPDPAIYNTALRTIACDPSTVVVLEDSVAGVRAAKAAGLFTVAVPDAHGRNDSRYKMADAVFESLVDVRLVLFE